MRQTVVTKQQDVAKKRDAAGKSDEGKHPLYKDDASKSMDVSAVADKREPDAWRQSDVCSRIGISEKRAELDNDAEMSDEASTEVTDATLYMERVEQPADDSEYEIVDECTELLDVTNDQGSPCRNVRPRAWSWEHESRYNRDSCHGDCSRRNNRDRYDDDRRYRGSGEHCRGHGEEKCGRDGHRDRRRDRPSSHHHHHHHDRDHHDHNRHSRDRRWVMHLTDIASCSL